MLSLRDSGVGCNLMNKIPLSSSNLLTAASFTHEIELWSFHAAGNKFLKEFEFMHVVIGWIYEYQILVQESSWYMWKY